MSHLARSMSRPGRSTWRLAPSTRRAAPIAALACILAAVAAAPGAASTTALGEVAPAGAAGKPCAGCTVVQTWDEEASPSYELLEGVITSWRVRGGPSVLPGDRVRLRVLRQGPAGWTVVSESPDVSPVAGQVVTVSTRIPVVDGQRIGLRAAVAGDTPTTWGGLPADTIGTLPGDPPPGTTASVTELAGLRVNAAVTLESDADRDGFGDDTQDADDDGDGISDAAETFLRTSRIDRDSDDDGLGDADEDRRGTDPARMDTDRDGLPDGLEVGLRRGIPNPPGAARGTDRRLRRDLDPRSRTDPLRRDSDRDRRPDGREDRNRNGRRDRGETDPRRPDTDGDAVPDGVERFPLDPRR